MILELWERAAKNAYGINCSSLGDLVKETKQKIIILTINNLFTMKFNESTLIDYILEKVNNSSVLVKNSRNFLIKELSPKSEFESENFVNFESTEKGKRTLTNYFKYEKSTDKLNPIPTELTRSEL